MDLTELRKEIDLIDRELVALLEKRMDVAAGVAAYKKTAGKPILDAGRELEKLRAVNEMCRPETADLITGLFSDLMAASRAYQARILESEP